eukprot:6189286-Pleurochrysis_carterae.AAC.1
MPDNRGLQRNQVTSIQTDIYAFALRSYSISFTIVNTTIAAQAMYSETIRYRNPISGTSTSAHSLNIARADEDDVPILQKGGLVCILPNQEDLQEGNMAPGDNIPFYLAEIQEDEDAPVYKI